MVQFFLSLDETLICRHNMMKESRSLKMQPIISSTCIFRRLLVTEEVHKNKLETLKVA